MSSQTLYDIFSTNYRIVMNWYRFKFVVVSLLLLPCIYFTNHTVTIGGILKNLSISPGLVEKLPDINNVYSYVVYILIVFAISAIMKCGFKNLPNKVELKIDSISKVYPASENFIPTFFAYIFLGLSINNFSTLAIVFFAIVIICYFGDMYLYNPIFYLLFYRYYYVEKKNGDKILILTKKKILKGNTCDFNDIREVNDHTYIDMED